MKKNRKLILVFGILCLDVCACVLGLSNYFICGLAVVTCGFVVKNIIERRHIIKNVVQLVLTLAVLALFAGNMNSVEYMSHNGVVTLAKLLECFTIYLCFCMAFFDYHGFGLSGFKQVACDIATYIICVGITITMNEAIFSATPLAMGIVRYVFSVAVLLLLVGGICLVFGSAVLGTLLSICILAFFGFANYFVFLFRGSPITWQDFSGAKTAAAVAGQYQYVFNAEGLIYLIILLGMVTYLIRSLEWKGKKEKSKKYYIQRVSLALAGCVLFAGTSSFLLYTDFMEEKLEVEVDVFLPKWTYWRYGEVLSMFSFMKQNRVSEPEGYRADEVETIQEEYVASLQGKEQESQAGIVPKNIVVIMNESLADLSIYEDLETNREVLPFISSMSENTYKGYAVVSPVGGGTCNSEYEFLTGNSMYVTPGAYVYNSLIKEPQQSVVATLEEQGYRSLAIHPNKGRNWNRTNVYATLGFDAFWSIDELEAMEKEGEAAFTYERGMMTDASLYDCMVEELKKQDDSMFIFAVTMQNHGGYDYDDFHMDDVYATNVKSDTLNQFLNLAYLSDQAFEELITSLQDFEEPTMVVMFGDHQPAVNAGVEEAVMGLGQENNSSTDNQSLQVLQKRRQTPLVIWTNYESDASNNNYMSLNYLSSVMLERAGLRLTPYNQYLLEMRQEIPVINEVGYMATDGQYMPFDYDNQWIRDYAFLVYSQIKDKKHCNPEFYELAR